MSARRPALIFDCDGVLVDSEWLASRVESELTRELGLDLGVEEAHALFLGKTVDGVAYPNNRFSAVFFQPFYAGQTFGLGQINPLTALMLSDMVARTSGYEKLDENDAAAVYTSIMDPDHSLAFMAAAIRKSIDDYRSIADMDISKNPGLTSTLYNVGGSQQRAAVLAQKNRQRAASGEQPSLPEENYYGWLVNDRIKDLQGLL